jgi:hypothetical protein
MGRTHFVRLLRGLPPAELRRYWRGTELVWSGPALYDVHMPRALAAAWARVETLTVVGPDVDHNTMFYNMSTGLLPSLRRVNLVDVHALETRHYPVPAAVEWCLPAEPDVAPQSYSRDVATSRNWGAVIRDRAFKAGSLRSEHKLWLGPQLGWYPRPVYEAWLAELLADPALALAEGGAHAPPPS